MIKCFRLAIFLVHFLVFSNASYATDFLSVGSPHACASDKKDVLRCWKNGTSRYHPSLMDFPKFKNLQDVSAGKYDHYGWADTCFIDDSGLRCFLGNGITNGKYTDMYLYNRPPLNKPSQVSVGASFACVIDGDEVKCWYSEFATPNRDPIPVPKLKKPRMISSGHRNACALDDKGIHCWGLTAQWHQKILDVPALTNPVSVSVGDDYACALDDSGVKCWGEPLYGRMDVPALKNPKAVVAGSRQSCALDDNGMTCWGMGPRWGAPPAQIPNLKNPKQVSIGGLDDQVCVRDDDGVKCESHRYGWWKKVFPEDACYLSQCGD